MRDGKEIKRDGEACLASRRRLRIRYGRSNGLVLVHVPSDVCMAMQGTISLGFVSGNQRLVDLSRSWSRRRCRRRLRGGNADRVTASRQLGSGQAQMQDGIGTGRAGERGNVVGFLVEAVANSLGSAGTAWAARIRSFDVQVPVPERAVGAIAVDVGAVVVDLVGQSVLELRDGLDGLVARNLERHTARRRSLVGFAVAGAWRNGGRALRVALSVDGPQVGVELAVVDDDGITRRRGGDGGSNGCEKGEILHCALSVEAVEKWLRRGWSSLVGFK